MEVKRTCREHRERAELTKMTECGHRRNEIPQRGGPLGPYGVLTSGVVTQQRHLTRFRTIQVYPKDLRRFGCILHSGFREGSPCST